MLAKLTRRSVERFEVVVEHLFKAQPAAWTVTAYAARAKYCGSSHKVCRQRWIFIVSFDNSVFAANILVQFRVYERCPPIEVARLRKMRRCD